MASFLKTLAHLDGTLDANSIISGACTNCDNAIWMMFDGNNEADLSSYPTKTPLFAHGYHVTVACFCQILHRFMTDQLYLCDGNFQDDGEDDDAEHAQEQKSEEQCVNAKQ